MEETFCADSLIKYEGKTKRILVKSKDHFMQFKDTITAKDGEKCDTIVGKGTLCRNISKNCFDLLTVAGIRNHLSINQEYIPYIPDCLPIIPLDMIPIEVVVRNYPMGSFLKRFPKSKSFQGFIKPVVEFFLKDDSQHDPLIEWDDQLEVWNLYNATNPNRREGYISSLDEITTKANRNITTGYLKKMKEIALSATAVLTKAWEMTSHDYLETQFKLIDIKYEFGFDAKLNIVLGDSIDPDSWRLTVYDDQQKVRHLDKQPYRESTLDIDCMFKMLDIYKEVFVRTDDWDSIVRGSNFIHIIQGSEADCDVTGEIQSYLSSEFKCLSHIYTFSAHKNPKGLLKCINYIDADESNVVYIAVAGKSNALGAVIDNATMNPVINCYPNKNTVWSQAELISCLNYPSKIGATTVMSTLAAAIAAAKIKARHNIIVWAALYKYKNDNRQTDFRL